MATEIEGRIDPDASTKNHRFKHIFEQDDGDEKTVFANTSPRSIEEATEQIDIDPDAWTYTKDQKTALLKMEDVGRITP